MENYNRMNVSTLKNLAREREVYSTLRKAELIEQLRNPPLVYTRPQLIQLARERGLPGYSTLRKAELIEQLRNPPLLYTRPQLIQLARERGLRGYSRLRKSQLIQRLRAPRGHILDQPIDARIANVPFLKPKSYTPPQATPSPTPSPSSNDVEDLINYLDNVREIPKNISPRVKKLQEEIKSIYNQMKLFEVRE